MSAAGPNGARATWLRKQADAASQEAESLRTEARARDKDAERFDAEADAAGFDDAEEDARWAELRAARTDRRQLALGAHGTR